MPEQKQGYMAELDQWTQGAILDPLYEAWRDAEYAPDEALEVSQGRLAIVVSDVKRAIREKVLDSYRNGQQAGPTKPKGPGGKPAWRSQRGPK
jgi:hypothetical protein